MIEKSGGESLEKVAPNNDIATDRMEYLQKNATVTGPEKGKPEHITTIRGDLAGKQHPDTGVPYRNRTVETSDGKRVEGVFPKFPSVYDTKLPSEQYKASDAVQFNTCNQKLKESVNNNPDLRSKFNDRQLEQIENGDRPSGYTWHHNEKKGRMQLVPTDVHSKTPHTGGRSIWGGGRENR